MTFRVLKWPGSFLVFIFLFFFALNLRQLIDFDVWFQLIAGQETVRTMAVPKAEFYIYSVIGEPSLFGGWLWGLLLFLAWLVGGYASVSVFNALVWAGLFLVAAIAILARIAREAPADATSSRKAMVLVVLLATSVAYQYLVERSVLRAEVTLYFAWVLAVYFSVGIADDEKHLRRFLIAVPLLSWILGWFHTTSIFMVFLLAGYLLQGAADAARHEGSAGFWRFVKTRSWPWLASMSAAMILPCLNPNGVQQALPLIAGLTQVLRGVFRGEQGKDLGQPVIDILEYWKLADVPSAWPIAILFLVCSIFVVWRDRHQRMANGLFLMSGMLLSLLHVRALALWAVFLMIPLGVAAAPFMRKAVVLLESKGRVALANALVVMCCFWAVGTVYNRQAGLWGVGYWPSPADEQLLQALRSKLPEGGRIFNWHPVGAYLRWHLGQNYLVAIDGHLTDGRSAAWKAYFDIENVADKGLALVDKWSIRAVYHPVLTVPHGSIHWLPHELTNSDNWRLIAGDRNGLLFTRVSKGEVDERTRNVLKIAYWQKVLIDATYVAEGATEGGNREQARAIVEHARKEIGKIQAVVK